MQFSLAFVALALALSGVVASPASLGSNVVVSFNLTPDTKYNAPLAPWESGCHPGWYFGSGNPDTNGKFPCIGNSCDYLKQHPDQLQCPPKYPQPSGYVGTFSGLTGATQASDYLTYGLVDTIADCQAMCNKVAGCKFVNTYHDVNGKNGSPLLTCSLFSKCHDSSDADNRGGQTQPNGSVDYITESDGWCKQ